MLSTNSSLNGMTLPVMTMADFNNERYGKAFKGVTVKTPPKRFPIVDMCIPGDGDWHDTASCVSALSSLGLNGIEIDGAQTVFDIKMLQMNGQHLTSGGIYAPPGAEPGTGLTFNATFMKEWGTAQFKSFLGAGFTPEQITTFALADEPGWYWPRESPRHFMTPNTTGICVNASAPASAKKGCIIPANAKALQAEWQAFLKLNKVTGLGAVPSIKGRYQGTPAEKKAFYWAARFSSYSSASAFARATAAMEAATVKGIPVYVRTYAPIEEPASERSLHLSIARVWPCV